MYEAFHTKDFTIKPYLMDHSVFDTAGFEITSEGLCNPSILLILCIIHLTVSF